MNNARVVDVPRAPTCSKSYGRVLSGATGGREGFPTALRRHDLLGPAQVVDEQRVDEQRKETTQYLGSNIRPEIGGTLRPPRYQARDHRGIEHAAGGRAEHVNDDGVCGGDGNLTIDVDVGVGGVVAQPLCENSWWNRVL